MDPEAMQRQEQEAYDEKVRKEGQTRIKLYGIKKAQERTAENFGLPNVDYQLEGMVMNYIYKELNKHKSNWKEIDRSKLDNLWKERAELTKQINSIDEDIEWEQGYRGPGLYKGLTTYPCDSSPNGVEEYVREFERTYHLGEDVDHYDSVVLIEARD